MDREVFLLQFKDQFIDADEISVTWTKPFREIGSFDSLTGMAIIVMIKDEFGVDIAEQEFKACLTPGDIYELVVSKEG